MQKHRSLEELRADLPLLRAAPKDRGAVDAIVVRPAPSDRRELQMCHVSRLQGVSGDRWSTDSWKLTAAGDPHPGVQVSIMSSRSIQTISGDRTQWGAAGDNFFVNFDLSQANLPAGTRFGLGNAVLQVSESPHLACATFIEHYGRAAAIFTNTGEGKSLKLRGVYACVMRDGDVRVGDPMVKLD